MRAKPCTAAAGPRRRESIGSRESRKPPSFEVPLSMVDIVFLLLIFFMVSAKFKTPERRMDIDLPPTGHVKPPQFVEPVMIHLLYSTRSTALAPRLGLRIRINERDFGSDLNVIYPVLNDLSAAGPRPVQILASGNAPFYMLMAAVDAAKRADMGQILFTLGEQSADSAG